MWFTSDTLFKSWLLLATARQRLLIFSDVVQLTKNYGFSAAILGFITSPVSTGLLCCRFRLFSSLPYVDLFWFHSPFSLKSSLKSVRFWDRSSIQSLLPTYVYFWTPCLTIYFIIIIFFVSAYGRKCTAFIYNFHLMWVKNLMYPRYYEAAGKGGGGRGGEVTLLPQKAGSGSRSKINMDLESSAFSPHFIWCLPLSPDFSTEQKRQILSNYRYLDD